MKRKVLFLIESLSGGGAEKVLSVILHRLDKDLFDITVCPIVDSGVYREAVKSCVSNYSPVICYDGGPIQRAVNRFKYKLVYSWLPLSWVFKLFIPKDNDVEIAFCEGFVTKLLSRSGSKAKKMAWVHTDLAANPWTLQQGIYGSKEEERLAYLRYDKVVCVSNVAEAIMQRDYGLDNTAVIYNPVDSDAILSASREDCTVTMDSSCFNIVAVGRLVPKKGFDELIRIVAGLATDNPKVQLYIVGEGSDRLRLEGLITECEAKNKIHLTGYLVNPYALMSRADLYVCPSSAEGFSLTVAEAMVLGIPIVSINSAGPAELLDNGRYGELCSDYGELSESLRKAVSDKEYLNDLRQRSGERKARFNIDDSLGLIKELLEAI